MAPFKSSKGRSGKKLLGVFNQPDLSLRGATQSNRVPPPTAFVASGGSKIPSGDYTYHVWTTDTPSPTANFNVTEGSRSLDILLVGGGGGAGGNNSGGGGAGGMVYGTGVITATDSWTNIPITIGTGGAGAAPEANGAIGSDTTFGSSPNPYYLIAKASGASGGKPTGSTGSPGNGSGGSGAGGPGNPTSSPRLSVGNNWNSRFSTRQLWNLWFW